MTTRRLKLADTLLLPADEAITQKYGFIGRSGSGKSYAAMKLAELFLGSAQAQIIALDWVGIWWSLRLARDGKHPGFEHVYIFGGEHADVDLRPESGALMADLVVDKHISVVLDVMHFRKAERTRFATAFAEQFFHRKKTARSACHLFIEEAQAYLPQMVRGDEARMVGVFEDIGKVGRNYGIGTSLISQRPQAINKDVLNQVEVLLAFQTNGPQERKAIAGWTAENTNAGAAMMQELPKLHVGDALVWSPQWLRVAEKIHIEPRDTYDASSTPTQQAKAIKPKTLAKADLEQLGEEIQATIEKQKADDPREFRKQIAALKRQLASGSAPSSDGKKQEVPVLTDADRALLERINAGIAEAASLMHEDLVLAGQRFKNAVDTAMGTYGGEIVAVCATAEKALLGVLDKARVKKVLEKLATIQPPTTTAVPRSPQPRRVDPGPPSTRSSPARLVSSNGDGSIGKGERKILTALAQYPDGRSKTQVAILTAYAHNGGGFNNYLSALRSKGFIDGSGDRLTLTAAGVDALGSYDLLPTGADLRSYWLRQLGKAERLILEHLVAVYPSGQTKDALGANTGYEPNGGGFNNALSRLRSLELIEGRGELRASAELFD